MKLAVVGATGLVGQEILKVLEERSFPFDELCIIANPNCSTIQMVLVLAPLHVKYKLKRIVVSTYQSVTGTGKDAVQQMMNERQGINGPKVYPHPIDMNA